MKALIDDFLRRGGTIWAFTPCVKARGYAQEDFIEGVKISGATVHFVVPETDAGPRVTPQPGERRMPSSHGAISNPPCSQSSRGYWR